MRGRGGGCGASLVAPSVGRKGVLLRRCQGSGAGCAIGNRVIARVGPSGGGPALGRRKALAQRAVAEVVWQALLGRARVGRRDAVGQTCGIRVELWQIGRVDAVKAAALVRAAQFLLAIQTPRVELVLDAL